VTSALTDANNNAATARASQITTMLTRLQQFKPEEASAIPLTDGVACSATDLQPLSEAGYCSQEDLTNQLDSTKGWVWNATTRKFTPEQP
jgi:hypothetical protein